jgi:oligopeptide/dipeptide ABC transporter ATP-binding protein
MPLLEVKNLKTYFKQNNGLIHRLLGQGPRIIKAVDDVSFSIEKEDTLALVGESGCGKTTVARSILRLIEPSSGTVKFDGQDLNSLNEKELRDFRARAQMILQDPRSSLNPRFIVEEIISEPYYIHNMVENDVMKMLDKVWNMLDVVGLPKRFSEKFPHELSGGQARRVGIARALALNPEFLVCDEPTAGLDVSVMAAVLNLMKNLQQEFKLTFLWISHNLHVVKHISNRVGVMYLGKLVEIGDVKDIFQNPLHPYTKALFSSIPQINKEGEYKKRLVLKGEVPSPVNPPAGCSFNPRCIYAKKICQEQEPVLQEIEKNHFVACHLYN